MGRGRSTLVLLLVALGFGGYLYFVDSKRPVTDANAKLPEVTEWAKMAYQAAPSGENLRTLIRLFQQPNPNISNRENLDVMRLMATSGGLVVSQDYLEYAEMASKTGIYGEVKTAIDAGRSKGVLSASQGGDLSRYPLPGSPYGHPAVT